MPAVIRAIIPAVRPEVLSPSCSEPVLLAELSSSDPLMPSDEFSLALSDPLDEWSGVSLIVSDNASESADDTDDAEVDVDVDVEAAVDVGAADELQAELAPPPVG